jgi:PIN domain nuclease of toxin-antitoxin system
MKYLLDTCTFLWTAIDSPKLSHDVKKIFLSPNKTLVLSVLSIWEIVLKNKLGRLPLPQKPKTFIKEHCFTNDIYVLALKEKHIYNLQQLLKTHKDPFDRMLICQAKTENLTILTPDKKIRGYDVKTMW